MSQFQYDGEIDTFKRMIGINPINNYVLHLFSNERTPGKSDTINEFTEIVGGGYASIEILPGDWTISDNSGVTIMSVTKNFHFTSAVAVVYGCYITNNNGTILIHAEALTDAPVEILGGGGDIEINLSFQFNG
jgi:hypothetical protein